MRRWSLFTHHVEGEDREEQHSGRKEHRMRRLQNVGLLRRHHLAEGRRRRRHAEPEKAQPRFGKRRTATSSRL